MLLGPIVARELMTLARRPAGYGARTVMPATLLAIVGANHFGWRYWGEGPSTVAEVARFGRLTFAQLAAAQIIVTPMLVAEFVARAIAEEKDRKTLTFLLTTRLSSAGIVLGKLGAGLWQYASCVAAGLPVVLLLPLFGGVEPELVLLAYAATASIALFAAGLSLAISVFARGRREAYRLILALVAAWLSGPSLLAAVLPYLAPAIYPWIRPANDLALASSPLGVLFSMVGLLPRGGFLEVLGWMIGLQVAGGVLFVVAAIAGLRPAYRRHEGGEARRSARGRQRWRPRRRPACGDRPVLWKELHVGGTRGFLRLLGIIAALVVLAGVGTMTYFIGRGAVEEVVAHGYGSTAPVNPFRVFFNRYLRLMTLLLSFIYALTLTGFAAEGIALERTRDTWLGLIATPLDGRDILRAKEFGAIWRASGIATLLVALWTVGLLAGAIHPLGFAAAMVGLGVTTWSCTALGTYGALRSRDLAGATNAALLPVLVLSLSGALPLALPAPLRTVLLGAGSFPLVETLALVSYGEVRAGLRSGPSPTLDELGITSGEGASRVLFAYTLGILGPALAALLLDRLARRRFDRLIGRPWRPSREGAQGREPATDGHGGNMDQIIS